MTEPILHPRTKERINHFLAKPSHAVMIVGARGFGKTYVAKYMASRLISSVNSIDEHPYIKILAPQPTSISIEQIRDLQKFLALKVPGEQMLRRLCIFENAELLTHEAQNALLKILEEPPKDTVLILLSETPNALLATIQSRVQRIDLLPVPAELLQTNIVVNDNVKRAVLLSAGRPGLFHALLNDDEHPLNKQIGAAKGFLIANQFDRLIIIQDYKEKPEIATFLEALLITSNAALKSAVKKDDKTQYKRWHERCRVIFDLQQKLELSVSTRLLLTSLALEV